jgi:hypothetical protein
VCVSETRAHTCCRCCAAADDDGVLEGVANTHAMGENGEQREHIVNLNLSRTYTHCAGDDQHTFARVEKWRTAHKKIGDIS